MTTPDGPKADLRFYDNVNDAMNDLYTSTDFTGMFTLHFSSGVPGKFAIKATTSGEDVVFGIHPTGSVDWDRVSREISNPSNAAEDISHVGIVYNASVVGSPDATGYVTLRDIQACDVLFIRKSVLEAISKKVPSVVSSNGKHSTFFAGGVYDGKYVSPVGRFVDVYKLTFPSKDIKGDVEFQCTKCAVSAFVGVVGNRVTLR